MPDNSDIRPCQCGHPYHRHDGEWSDRLERGILQCQEKGCPCNDFVEQEAEEAENE